ncbi:MAG: hypothetical protein AB1716_14095, partial [Planctomycetota bacterium]
RLYNWRVVAANGQWLISSPTWSFTTAGAPVALPATPPSVTPPAGSGEQGGGEGQPAAEESRGTPEQAPAQESQSRTNLGLCPGTAAMIVVAVLTGIWLTRPRKRSM